MNCRQSRKLFGAYWDDELTLAERDWLETHFASCRACREAYEGFSQTIELVEKLPRAEVRPDFAESVLSRARRATAAPDRLPVESPRWIPATAAVALVVIAGTLVLQMWGSRTTLPVVPGGPVAVQVAEPVRVTPGPGSTAPPPMRSEPGQQGALLEPLSLNADSLFDRADDIEFMLDPVTVRKGRAHRATRVAPPAVTAEAATITF
jgi:anti-sigma factor RsiW